MKKIKNLIFLFAISLFSIHLGKTEEYSGQYFEVVKLINSLSRNNFETVLDKIGENAVSELCQTHAHIFGLQLTTTSATNAYWHLKSKCKWNKQILKDNLIYAILQT